MRRWESKCQICFPEGGGASRYFWVKSRELSEVQGRQLEAGK